MSLDALNQPGAAAETAPQPSGCVEGYVSTNGVRLHYVAAGRGPLVLLLHGFPEFCSSWVLRLR
jgi:hypothetical protein